MSAAIGLATILPYAAIDQAFSSGMTSAQRSRTGCSSHSSNPMSILFACAGRTGASNDTAMGLGLMIPSIAPAKAANSCDAATTASAQPVVVYDPFIAMQADMLRMNTEMNRVMQAAFTAAPTDHMQTSYKDSKYTITVPRKASIEHTADKPEQGLCI